MKKEFKPESLMMTYGYKPELSEGAVKCPIFQTSTFVFKTAEEGKSFFEVAYGLREKEQEEELGLIYSRINNPNIATNSVKSMVYKTPNVFNFIVL